VTELPTGSLVGLVMFALVLGIVLGRSARFMRALGTMHASAHGGAATGGAATAHQTVSTVVVVDRDGQPIVDGRYVLDAELAAPAAEITRGDADDIMWDVPASAHGRFNGTEVSR